MKQKTYTYPIKALVFWTLALELIIPGILALLWFYLPELLTVFGLKGDQFRFERPEFLPYAFTLPALSLLWILKLSWKNKALFRFSDSKLLKHLVAPVNSMGTFIQLISWRLCFLFLILGLANPQYGTRKKTSQTRGIDIVLAIDVSKSMDAKDGENEPSRLEKTQKAVKELIRNSKGDRIGLVVFAGEALVRFPLTNDYSAAMNFVEDLNTGLVPTPGTAIGAAIETGSTAFNFKENTQKALVIITDGEDHEEGVVKATKMGKEKGISIHAIGIGSPEGVPIPVFNKRGERTGFKKDQEGNTVVSKLNESMLREIASTGEGIYIESGKEELHLNKLINHLDEIEKSDLQAEIYEDYEDRFRPLIFFALFFLLLYIFVPERKVLSLFLIALGVSMTTLAQSDIKNTHQGNLLYQEGKYDAAREKYDKALELNPENQKALFNKADALFHQDKLEESLSLYSQLETRTSNKATKAKALHNMGNIHLKKKEYQKAAETYKKALINNPQDEESRYNLAYSKKMLQQNQEQQKKDEQKKDEQEKDQEKQDQQNKEEEKKEQEKKEQDPKKLSPEDAKRMLNAYMRAEKEKQKKEKQEKQKVTLGAGTKDW